MGALSSFSLLVGSWSTSITMLHPNEQLGRKYSARDTYRWLPGDNVLIHEVHGEMNGAIMRSIEIFTADADLTVRSRSYDSRGGVTDYQAEMTDSALRINGEKHRIASTVVSSELIEGKWQLLEAGDWLDWMTVSLTRIAER